MVIGLEQLNSAVRINANKLVNDTARDIKSKIVVSYPEVKLSIKRIETTAATTRLEVSGISEIDKDKHGSINRKIISTISDVIKKE